MTRKTYGAPQIPGTFPSLDFLAASLISGEGRARPRNPGESDRRPRPLAPIPPAGRRRPPPIHRWRHHHPPTYQRAHRATMQPRRRPPRGRGRVPKTPASGGAPRGGQREARDPVEARAPRGGGGAHARGRQESPPRPRRGDSAALTDTRGRDSVGRRAPCRLSAGARRVGRP